MTKTFPLKLQTGKLLLDEAPLVILPSLAIAIGLEAAVVLQQLHFLIRMKLERHKEQPKEIERDIHDGRVWIWNTYEKWKENYFNFLSVRSLQRIFINLEKQGLIVSGNYNESNLNKTKWYSVNYDHHLLRPLAITEGKKTKDNNNSSFTTGDQRKTVIDHAKLASSTCQSGMMDSAKLAPHNTKNTYAKNTTTTENAQQSSSNRFKKKETNICTLNNNFPIPETTEEVEQIIRDVLKIVYPNGERIRNKNNLIAAMKKKLLSGFLEIPEGWQALQKTKKETTNQKQEIDRIAEEEAFKKAKAEFDQLSENEQKKYLDAARKTAKSIASVMSESTILRVAICLAAKEKLKQEDVKVKE